MKTLHDINTSTPEGKVLLATLGRLTTQEQYSSKTPDETLQEMYALAQEIYNAPRVCWLVQQNDFIIGVFSTPELAIACVDAEFKALKHERERRNVYYKVFGWHMDGSQAAEPFLRKNYVYRGEL